MTPETIDIILETLMAETSRNFSEKEVALKVRTWNTILKDVTDEQGLKGLEKALENPGEFMPPVGKFKQMCLSGQGCDNLEDEAMTAWALVIKYLNAYSSPIFKDSSIAESIRNMGGWKQLCGMLVEDEPFRKKDFIAHYTICRRRNKEYSPMLRGIYGNEYKFIGYSKADNLHELLAMIETEESRDKQILTKLLEGK